MKFVKTMICLLLCMCLLTGLPLPVEAQEDLTPYIQRMIQYYLHYQSAADTEIETLLDYIQSEDPGQGALWRSIMDDWRRNNEEMPVYRDVLPDGLPGDDSLCIVILGYGLRDDGSMREELVDRLVVGLASALKYPNAWVCVTGGPTADDTEDTEAGQMAAWLIEKGLEPGRILVEDRALSTAENARNVCKLLRVNVPQVDSVAVVSSDYHIPWGMSMFTTETNCLSYYNGKTIRVVGNAANTTGNTASTLYSQAWGISILTDTPFKENAVPAMYATETTQETLPVEVSQVEVREEAETGTAIPGVLSGTAALVFLISIMKRRLGKK